MEDIRHRNNLPPFTINQIHDLVAALREVFGSNLSQAEFSDRLLMFLEDVPGYESGEVSSPLIESAWAEYASHRGKF